jgi:hypothetical protein
MIVALPFYLVTPIALVVLAGFTAAAIVVIYCWANDEKWAICNPLLGDDCLFCGFGDRLVCGAELMWYKTSDDYEAVAAAHRGGYLGTNDDAFIGGELLIKISGIWLPADTQENSRFAECVARGRERLAANRVQQTGQWIIASAPQHFSRVNCPYRFSEREV